MGAAVGQTTSIKLIGHEAIVVDRSGHWCKLSLRRAVSDLVSSQSRAASAVSTWLAPHVWSGRPPFLGRPVSPRLVGARATAMPGEA